MENHIDSPEMAVFKKNWIGKAVRVTERSHPHFNAIGEVTGIENTPVGLGMKIKNTQNDSIFYGEEFFVFKGSDIQKL